jgi:hypothetical protein
MSICFLIYCKKLKKITQVKPTANFVYLPRIMSNTQLTSEQSKLLENPDITLNNVDKIRLILHDSEKYSDEDIHVIKGAIIRNKYWGWYRHYILKNTDDPRLLIPFLDDGWIHDDELAEILYFAIDCRVFDKARILIEYGADIEASRAYVEIDQRERYEDNLREVIPPAVKSANKV